MLHCVHQQPFLSAVWCFGGQVLCSSDPFFFFLLPAATLNEVDESNETALTVKVQAVRNKTMTLKLSVELRGTVELGDNCPWVCHVKRPLPHYTESHNQLLI